MAKNAATRKKQDLNRKLLAVNLKRDLDNAYEAGDKDGFYNCLTIFLYELRNVYGFGEERLTRLVKKVIDLAGSIDEGYVSVDDIRAQLREECGIILDWRKATDKYQKTGIYPDWRDRKGKQNDCATQDPEEGKA